jgi:hypothetical protein
MNLRALAFVSGIYDLLLGLALLLLPVTVARLFGAAPPQPVVNAQLNGVFALALAFGYFRALREAGLLRGFLWVAGVFAKGLGASVLVLDHFVRHSPTAFLLFAACDGALAAVTLAALLRRDRPRA